MTIWGVDPSTVRVSVAILGSLEGQCTWRSIGVAGVPIARLETGMRRTLSLTRELAEEFPPEEIWVEQPSGRYRNPQLVYMVGAVLTGLHMGAPRARFFTVPPPSWKKAALGDGMGNASKPQIMAWARAEMGYDGNVQDEADAIGVARGGSLLTGAHPKVMVLKAE